MNNHPQSGQILVLALIALSIVFLGTLLIVAGSTLYFQNATYTINSEKALNIAEAGMDQAIASINTTGGSYSGTGSNGISFGDGEYITIITTKADGVTKVVESTGYIPNKTNPKSRKTVKAEASRGIGVAFVYGVQIGAGGFEMGNSNTINGSIYSNGNIEAGNNNVITGDAWVAGGTQPQADQQPNCVGANCADFIFGKNVSGDDRLDIAQSFKPTTTEVINKVLIKIKKFGNPPDITVRIMEDQGGRPDKNGVLTSGSLYSNLVTGDYGWIEVTFNSLPKLTAETTYWIVLDTSSNNSNYWSWQNDIAQGYTRGLPKWSPNWNTGNPTWNAFSGDLSFQTYMGGSVTKLEGENPQQPIDVGGNAHANTIIGSDIGGDAYYKTIADSTVAGTSHPGYDDPPPKVFPVSEANIIEWQNQATAVETRTGDVGCVATLASGKIVGSVNLGSNCNVTITTPIWITGNLTMDSHNTITLASSYGTTSGVIVVGDASSGGIITLNSNNHLNGTGQGSSLVMALSTYDSRTNGISAIKFNSNGNSGVFYANNGIIEPGTGNTFKELTGWKIKVLNSSIIEYETGLASTLFSAGPSGSYTLVKGSYQIKK
ncbi:hypothetical protein HYW46_03930 [Candidatus Daviesbacteria bacterium]|nr:hypothetical protein [Candidatus Daviesbacteria bacterium]